MLFARGADISQGQLLHHAVLRPVSEDEVIKLVELLLGKGASVNEIQYENHPQTYGELVNFSLGTPPHYAAQAGKRMVVSYLLEKGADLSIKIHRRNQNAIVQIFHKLIRVSSQQQELPHRNQHFQSFHLYRNNDAYYGANFQTPREGM